MSVLDIIKDKISVEDFKKISLDLSNEILPLLKESVQDLWKTEDIDFLKQLAEDVAREKILSVKSDNPEEHKKNLKHLAATIQSKAVERQIKLNRSGKKFFVRILSIVIKAISIETIKKAINK